MVLVCEKGLCGQRAAEVAGRTGKSNTFAPGRERGGRGGGELVTYIHLCQVVQGWRCASIS